MKSPEPARAADSNVVSLGRRFERRAAFEFLPGALEVLETPVSPLGRAVAATIALFFVVALSWAYLGHVDIIASATGKIIPDGRSKTIQPLEPGIVSAIRVQDGDHVKAGQVLVELDPTLTVADKARASHDYMMARLDVARLTSLRNEIDGHPSDEFDVAPGTPSQAVEQSRAAMTAQSSEQKSKVAGLEQQIAQKRSESDQITETIAKYQALLPLLEEEAQVRRKAMEIEFGNRIAYLEAQQKYVDEQHELVVQQHHLLELAAARKALEQQLDQTRAEYARNVLNDLSDAQRKSGEYAQDLAKSTEKLDERVLRSPVDGTVQQLIVHTIGGVVTPAQQLMTIVPEDNGLVVEAMVSNQDIGFVHPGQDAEIKIDTFNFTRYGLLHGQVISVSRDSIVQDKPADKSGSSADDPGPADSSEPKGQQLTYSARVALGQSDMMVEGKRVQLGPGMAVTVEIKTGSRRVIEYLLSPLLRYRHDSLTER